MKKTIVLFAILIASFSSFATIRRVNNNPGVTLVTNLVFNSLNTAIAVAVSGDTIYLEPSDINYGDLTFTKRLTVIGPGYLLNKNPNTPFDKRSASISSIFFQTNYQDSKIFGLEFKNESNIYSRINTIGQLEISYCIFYNLDGTSNESRFNNNIILGDISNSIQSSIFSNNIIFGSVNSTSSTNIFKNNIIFGGSIYKGTYFNNIVYTSNIVGYEFNQNTKIFNNVCVGCTGTPINNNFFTTASNTIFNAAEPRNLDDLRDDLFQLPSTSPAKAKGVAGIDCGVFSGANPYVLSGIPPFPMLTAYAQGTLTAGSLPITISIKRN